MEDRKNNNEIKTSRNGLCVPVINGIHLHSIYNPIKEAEAFANGFTETLKKNNSILVLGLGFGYHIDQIANELKALYADYSITVLEPNRWLAESFMEKRGFEDKNIQILCTENIDALFADNEFINFLRLKPSIIKYDPSFTLEKDFYTKFLKFKAPTNIDRYFHMLEPRLQDYFRDHIEEEKTLSQFTEEIKTKTGVNSRLDYLMLALDSIKTNAKTTRGL